MPQNEQRRLLDEADLIAWREATMRAENEAIEIISDTSIISNPLSFARQLVSKSAAQLPQERKQSLLTRALQPGQEDNGRPAQQIYMSTEMARQRSSRSTTSTASTMDLISDDGLTSPTRTSTPSPPYPTYTNFAPGYTLGPKLAKVTFGQPPQKEMPLDEKMVEQSIPQPDPAVEALVKKRCISFACAKPKEQVKPVEQVVVEKAAEPEPPKKRSITFACANPKEEVKPVEQVVVEKAAEPKEPPRRTIKFAYPCPPQKHAAVVASPVEKIPTPAPAVIKLKVPARRLSRSPSMTRKPRPSTPKSSIHRDSTSTIRRASQSPETFRSRKPKYIAANDDALESSEARFHAFASDEPQDDDWIRKDCSHEKTKITISDTLRKENAIRQLAEEAEEEALEDDEDEDNDEEDEDEDEDEDDDNDDDDDEDEDDEEFDVEDEENRGRTTELETDDASTISDIDSMASDGNESDNEAGFADSDDDSNSLDEYAFWTPGNLFASSGEANTFRPSMRTRRAPSESSIDSLSHMSPLAGSKSKREGRMKPSRKIKIRPGTPDLPDSTDFVCGTLDEDRPLEEAYISCMEARRRQKRHLIPQDIDPSFPTSDPEDEEDEVDEVEQAEDSEGDIWLHGKFEDSDSGSRHRRRQKKSPKPSPRKRLHSPPPKGLTRHRSPPPKSHRSPPPKLRSPPTTAIRNHSPPPRKLFGTSPRTTRRIPSQIVRSPPASLTHANAQLDGASSVLFAPLGIRPGLTHTTSLPRRGTGFAAQYRASKLEAALMEEDEEAEYDNFNDGIHTRGAIDIVKGLEQKRERRKEKFYSKLCEKKRKEVKKNKGQLEPRRPVPGRGAERMMRLGLMMAGKNVPPVNGAQGKAEYVLSV